MQNAAKKPHKMKKSADLSADFNFIKDQTEKFFSVFDFFLSVAFVLR